MGFGLHTSLSSRKARYAPDTQKIVSETGGYRPSCSPPLALLSFIFTLFGWFKILVIADLFLIFENLAEV